MTSENINIYEILLKKKAGLCSEEEEREIDERLSKDPEAQAIWEELNADIHGIWKDPDTEKAFQVAQLRIWERKQRKTVPFFYKAAAAIILVISVMGIYHLWPRKHTIAGNEADTTHSFIALPDGNIIPLQPCLSDTTDNGTRLTIPAIDLTELLPAGTTKARIVVGNNAVYKFLFDDGTSACTNSNTTFSFDYSALGRKFTMNGEIYFEVGSSVSRPFTVITKGTTIEALGTIFNVNTYGNTNQVALVSGAVKVTVDATRQPVLLKPGYLSDLKGDSLEIRENSGEITWMSDTLEFYGTPLWQIIEQVRYGFSVPIICSNPEAATHKFSGGFIRGEQPEKLVDNFEAVQDPDNRVFTWKKIGDTIVITALQPPKK